MQELWPPPGIISWSEQSGSWMNLRCWQHFRKASARCFPVEEGSSCSSKKPKVQCPSPISSSHRLRCPPLGAWLFSSSSSEIQFLVLGPFFCSISFLVTPNLNSNLSFTPENFSLTYPHSTRHPPQLPPPSFNPL